MLPTDIRRPLPELERVSLHLQSTNTSQSCRLQSAITAIPCNLPSCSLQSTYTAECTLPYCIILKGTQESATGRNRLPQACNLLAQMASNPPEINENLWKSMKIGPLASMGNGQ